MKTPLCLPAICVLLLTPTAGSAGELFAGGFMHDVPTPLTYAGYEPGGDLQLGWRGDRIQAWRRLEAPSPYAFVSANSAGATNFAAAGLSWKFGDKFFVRPGIGVAIHDGPGPDPDDNRVWFGSRMLFEPELGLGWQINEATSLEASWVHLSHAQLAGAQNPGMDNIGIRLSRHIR